ncbi:phage holin [Metabacillus indicus]|uniref:phage holin n=1 Tax=Metabacillus indicus TaxID=246786 RepID=UPI00068AEA4F|nr:phage holin [Metabacillus indicus]
MMKDTFTLLGGFLTALLFFFGTIGITFDWFTEESINAFVFAAAAFAALVINLYAIWKNTFISKQGQIQKKALQAQNLLKK